jgi:hypothetical protein
MVKNQKNKNGMREGYWEEYYGDHKLLYKGYYNNGNIVGYWEYYNIATDKLTKEYYLVD